MATNGLMHDFPKAYLFATKQRNRQISSLVVPLLAFAENITQELFRKVSKFVLRLSSIVVDELLGYVSHAIVARSLVTKKILNPLLTSFVYFS